MEKQRVITLVTGKTGRGKSHYIKKYLVPEFIKKGLPVVIADSMAEYSGEFKNYPVYNSFDGFYSGVKMAGQFKAVNLVEIKRHVDALKLFAFCESCQVPHVLLVEEASKYMSPHQINPHLNEMVAYGRHYGYNLIFTAQRFAQMHKIVTSQADFIFSFAQTEAADLKAIANYLNDTDIVKSLDKRQFVAFGDIPESSQFSAGKVYTLDSKNKIRSI